jgi:CBS domain-containing protein
MHTVRSLVRRRELVAAPSLTPVLEAAIRMRDEGVGALCVVDEGRLVGIFSERDLMTRVVVPGKDPRRTTLEEVMTADVVTAALDETRRQCLDRMREERFRHLPILDGNQVVGMVSMRDLLRDEIAEQREEIVGLHAYLHSTPL